MKTISVLFLSVLCFNVFGAGPVYTSSQVQAEITAAVAAGQATYTFPNGTIYCTSTIRVMPGTRNFTLQGQPLTRLVRATPSDITLLLIGDDEQYCYNNASFTSLTQYPVLPVVEGQNYVDLISTATLPAGWYALIGIADPTDKVKKIGTSPTYWYKREIFKITGQTGLRATLNQAVGRNFESAKLVFLQSNANPNFVCENITLKDFELDGAFTPAPDRRASTGARAARSSKVLVMGTVANSSVTNLYVRNFVTAGINVKFSKNITLRDLTVSDGDLVSLGYGIEVGGSRNVNVYTSLFDRLRLAVNYQMGSMDGLVQDCFVPPGGGWFDVGHGTGEKRITHINCIADQISLANGQWLRGVDEPKIFNCSARQQINVFPGTRGGVVQGLYSNATVTAPRIIFFTEGGTSAVPNTPQWVESCQVNFAKFNNPNGSGQSVLQASSTGQQHRVGNWVFNRCDFINDRNGSQNGGAAVDLTLGCANINNNVLFDNCLIRNSNGYQAPVRIGSNPTGVGWNIQFLGNTITNPVAGGQYITHGVNIAANSGGLFDFTGNGFNGATMTPSHVINNGLGQVIFH